MIVIVKKESFVTLFSGTDNFHRKLKNFWALENFSKLSIMITLYLYI